MKKTAEMEKSKQAKDKTIRNRNKRKCKRKKGAKQLKTNFDQSFPRERTSVPKPSPPSTGSAMLFNTPPSFVQLKNAQNVWIKTYQNAVRWQYQHQLNYWKHCTLRLREENARLRRRLAVQDSEEEEEEAEARAQQQQQRRHGTTAVKGEESADEALLDEEFIAFMEVSARHRLERRRLKNESVH
ncbi:uncharacterized protein LOC131680738 [Topomyia yanbarensis]|uniref:uncharacterized protein LOC131680738 n=1 Tax=Topomyia yanbarensis TaxID=2498891 RepID=UPI00273AACC8|nr:uncharacterized protein LOC131680738 [Topomyia yanbarensis]